ncbi:MAG: hypothetical protein KBA96_04720 [Rhodocyclaceae bacterium]|nr:hypothetical protein [Rhodocyclaceae bacterium]
MNEIHADIADENFGRALIRLWLLAESTINGVQQLSHWLTTFDTKRNSEEVEWLTGVLDKGGSLSSVNGTSPLALIAALDNHVAGNTQGVWSPGNSVTLEHDDCTYWLVRRDTPPKPEIPAERQNPNLEHWFRHFRVIPSRIKLGGANIDIELKVLNDVSVRAPRSADPTISVRFTHFDDGVALCVARDISKAQFHATGVSDTGQRSLSLRAEFDLACNNGAQLWVVPELSATAAMRTEVAGWLADLSGKELRPLLCVPGSFHDELDGTRVNRAEIIDSVGRVVSRHDKLTQFSFNMDGITLTEGITVSRRIELLVTPIGIVGIAICKDFSDAATEIVNVAWNRLAPDWLLVPSMGDNKKTMTLHRSRAEDHWKMRGTRCVVANQAPHIDGNPAPPEPAPGFVSPEKSIALAKRRMNLKRIK